MNDDNGPGNPSTTRESGKDFERLIADFYRSLGCKVVTNIRLIGQEIDLLVTRHVEGVGILTFMVECKDWNRPLGNQDVQNFIATVATLRANGLIQTGVMVSRKGYTPDAKASAEQIRYVTLLTPEDLEQEIMSATSGMRQLIHDYQDQDIFDDFVEIDGYRTTWLEQTRGKSDVELTNVCEIIRASIVDARSTNFFLLADYGSGKSTLLRRLQYQLSVSKLSNGSPYLPVFVPLKNYYDLQDFSILLRNSIREDFFRDLSNESLWLNIRRGRFAFLLDGFDEMADRSGVERRYDLFLKMLPVLNSPCPTILTSRPSLFVAKGEIEELVSRWRTEATPLRPLPPLPNRANKDTIRRYNSLEELKENLMVKLRSGGPRHGDVEVPTDETLVVINLEPFDDRKIEQYIGQRFESFSAASQGRRYNISQGHHYSVKDTLAFIKRVYDLTDLASRPLLLRLIIDTILEGGIDVKDPALQFGPSGLYELYTSIKLDVDWEKGAVRRGALTRDQRRELAEAVAKEMHKASTLTVNLSKVLSILPTSKAARRGVVLSAEEIATDFLTCSFLTIDGDRNCRFVHRSFLEFFVARNIKNHLSLNNPLLLTQLPTAILYFLGGFAPTEPSVADRLWMLFNKAPVDQRVLRRNLLAAYLLTRTNHASREIGNVEIDEAAYGDLILSQFRARKLEMRDVAIRHLDLLDSDCSDVTFEKCAIRSWRTLSSLVSCTIRTSEYDVISFKQGSNVQIALHDGPVNSIEFSVSNARIELSDASIGKLSGERCTISIEVLRSSKIAQLHFSHSDISLTGGNAVGEPGRTTGLIRRSIVRISGGYEVPKSLEFDGCFVHLTQHKLDSILSQMSPDSCVFGIGLTMENNLVAPAVPQVGKNIRCGVLGVTYDGPLKALDGFSGWGVLVIEGDASLKELSKTKGYKVISEGLIVCNRKWFTQETAADGVLNIAASFLETASKAEYGIAESMPSSLEMLRTKIVNLR